MRNLKLYELRLKIEITDISYFAVHIDIQIQT